MSDFFRGLEEGHADLEGRAETNYDEKMLKRLLDKVAESTSDAKRIRLEARSEFGFHWFNNTYSCPVKLHARRLGITDIFQLIVSSRFPKSPVWKAYFEVKAEHAVSEPVGLVFRISSASNWIIHNDSTLPLRRGKNVIVRPASDDDKRLIICEYDAFLAELKEVWTP